MSRLRRKKPGKYHHGDLRQALIDGALRVLERERVEDLSLRALGRELGVSPRAPYRHFGTKEALLAAVAVEGLRRFEAFVTPRVEAAGPNPVAKLRAIAEAYVLFAVEHPAAFRIMYAPYAIVEESSPELVRARAEGHRANMSIIVAAQEAGLLRPGDPMHHALAFWTGMHGLAVLLIEGQLGRYDRPIDAVKLASVVSRSLLEGLLVGPDIPLEPAQPRVPARNSPRRRPSYTHEVMAEPAVATPPAQQQPPADDLIVLRGATWADYQRLLAIRGERSVPRITYLEGVLELMSPSRPHESIKSMIGRLVEAWCLERGVEISPYGSWTHQSERDERGVEPDECYVLGDDPEPERCDLAIEVVWTRGTVDKIEVYPKLAVRELWIWKGGALELYSLEGERYVRVERSALLPELDLEELLSFVDIKPMTRAVREYRAKLAAALQER